MTQQQDLVERVRHALRDRSPRELPMFGGVSFMVEGRMVVGARREGALLPVQLATRLGIAPSTVHRILTTAHLNRLSYVDRATGEPIGRYEHAHPGSLVHVDVKNLGSIPEVHDDEPLPQPRVSCTGRSSGSPTAASPSTESCRTTAARTSHTCGAGPAMPCRSRRSGPDRTARRPTARSRDSIAPWPTDGRMPAATPASRNDATRLPTGCITTASTVRTQRSATSHHSHDWINVPGQYS